MELVRRGEVTIEHLWYEKTLGLVIQIAAKYWRQLPPNVQMWMDIDDLVNEILLLIVSRADYYRGTRGAITTFVHTVAVRHCLQILERYNFKNRKAGVVSIDSEDFDEGCLRPRGISVERRVAAKTIIERLIYDASPELRHTLALIIEGKERVRHLPQSQIQELRRLGALHGASVQDFSILRNSV